ncbi:hypothetical protein F4861DRAFT_501013 [Xylaria intraflava]|nr:hypothetical protein F4861DRAFT_501013 [Xylaria intraflava]
MAPFLRSPVPSTCSLATMAQPEDDAEPKTENHKPSQRKLASRALTTAAARVDLNRHSTLEAMPHELKLMIICWLPDIRSIYQLALTGPELYVLVRAHEKHIVQEVMRHSIDAEVLYLALTRRAILSAQWKAGGDDKAQQARIRSGRAFAEQYINPAADAAQLEARTRGLQFREASPYLSLHSSIGYYAEVLARRAAQTTPKAAELCPGVSSAVPAHYERALYIIQLASDYRNKLDLPRPPLVALWAYLSPADERLIGPVLELLRGHIDDVLGEEQATGYPCHIRNSMVKNFIMRMGPERLWELELAPTPRSVLAAFQNRESRYLSLETMYYYTYY